MHRIYWDLRDTPSKRVTYRTSPLYAPDIRVGPDGIRESEGGFGTGGGGLAVMQAPGTYTVKLTVGGRDYSQPLRVLKDPHSAGTEADIEAQHRMLLDVRRDLDVAVDAVNGAEMVRGQIAHLLTILDDVTPLRDLTPQVLNADAHLFTPRPAYRFRAITAPATPYDDLTVGDNPPYGADINYYLKAAAPGPVTIAIQDA
ncbi:MAG: hypothetical protein JF613_06350, partial [Acidobacteria bacterium]|nr:hypothetical protein [Acidobacteriota bacterium]